MTAAPLFLVPMRSEMFAVRLGAPRVQLMRTGMGPARATEVSRRVATSDHERPVIVLGICGGLSSELRANDVIVGSSVGLVGEESSIDLPIAKALGDALIARGQHCRVAPLVGSPTILHGDDNRKKAARNGAVAVDMESYWCAEELRGRPFGVVRVVLDSVGDRFLSPKMVGALGSCFGALVRTARAVAAVMPTLTFLNSSQQIG